MTDEKKKPESNEVGEEELKEVSGGITDIRIGKKKVTEPLNKSMDREGTIET